MSQFNEREDSIDVMNEAPEYLEDSEVIEVANQASDVPDEIYVDEQLHQFKKFHYGLLLSGKTLNGYKIFRDVNCTEAMQEVAVTDGSTIFTSNFVFCYYCKKIYAKGGGHTSRHKKSCEEMHKTVHQKEVDETRDIDKIVAASCKTDKLTMSEIFSSFIVNSGSAIKIVETDAFRNLILETMRLSVNISDESFDKIMPKRKTVRETMTKLMNSSISNVRNMVKPELLSSMACFSCDFGRNFNDFFSLKVSYISTVEDENGNKKWMMSVLPICMTVCNESSKNANLVAKLVAGEMKKMDLNDLQLENFFFVADAAAYNKKCGEEYFLSYIRCAAHLANLLAKHTLWPYRNSQLTASTRKNLEIIRILVEDCNKLAVKIKKKHVVSSKLQGISTIVETRFLTHEKMLRGILKNIDKIVGYKQHFDSDCQNLIDKINNSRLILEAILGTLEVFDEVCVFFQKDDVQLHAVLPCLVGLIKHFDSRRNSNDEFIKALAESAVSAVKENFNDINEYHCLGYLLDPQRPESTQQDLNSLSINMDISTMGKSALLKICSVLGLRDDQTTPSKTRYNSPCGFLAKCLKKEQTGGSIEMEFQRYLTTQSTLDIKEFWPANIQNFPNIYLVAKKLMGVVASESSTERSFSLVKNVFRVNRRRLNTDFLEKLLVCHELEKD